MGFQSFHPDPAEAKPLWGYDDFRYVHHSNIGPYFLRRTSYQHLGGFELFTPHERERNRLASSSRIYERYASRTAEIDALVGQANTERPQAQPVDPLNA